MKFSRRRFVGSLSAGTAWKLFPPPVLAQSPDEERLKAEAAAFDLGLLDDWLTPNELFFVRDHFPAPKLSSHDWKLSIGGAVKSAWELSYDELVEQPRAKLPVTLECAENPVGGGLVSNANWEGVSLAGLLQKAGLRAEAPFVRFVGADSSAGSDLRYSRSIPLEKAVHSDTLLADRMNGDALPASHGFPLRAVVPGSYAMDSVKWLQEVQVLAEEDESPFMTQLYQRQRRSGSVTLPKEPINVMNVKSAFSRPLDGAILWGRRFVVRGAAWAGPHAVQLVEVSTDGGSSWRPARLAAGESGSAPRPYAWVHWSYDWRIPRPGQYELVVRAQDDKGRQQPADRPKERLDAYELNSLQTVRCVVR